MIAFHHVAQDKAWAIVKEEESGRLCCRHVSAIRLTWEHMKVNVGISMFLIIPRMTTLMIGVNHQIPGMVLRNVSRRQSGGQFPPARRPTKKSWQTGSKPALKRMFNAGLRPFTRRSLLTPSNGTGLWMRLQPIVFLSRITDTNAPKG